MTTIRGTYDDELLNVHFVTGDGRGNENIALTTVHSIFHSEHNRLVDVNKATILAAANAGDIAFLNEWLLTDVTAVPADPSTLVWDGERLFQAARFGTEMQYQHMVFEEFARRIQPVVDPFIFNTSPNVDSSVVAEFAHTVYRFGHSMLTGTVDRLTNDLQTVDGGDQKTLLAVFLNPQQYLGSGDDLATINANIVRGLSRDVGNAMDEFIVTNVRSQLLGLPLDLAVLNLARGRDTGIPSLNQTREQLYNDTGFADLKPYTSWQDFALNIKHAASVINFIAAYGTHGTITSATTIADKRAAAEELVFGVDGETPTTRVGVPHRSRRLPDKHGHVGRRGDWPERDRSVDRRPGREEPRIRRHAGHDLQLRVRVPDGEPAVRRPLLLSDPDPGHELPQQPRAQHLRRHRDAQHRSGRRVVDAPERPAVRDAGPHHRARSRHRAGRL